MPVRIRRILDWIPKSLQQYATRNPVPEAYWEIISPAIDSFGTSRIGEHQFAEISTGGIELSHTEVPPDSWRLYVSAVSFHDDPAAGKFMRFGRVVRAATPAFPFAQFRDDIFAVANQNVAVANIAVGPGDFFAHQVFPALPPATSQTMRLVWIDFPVGEYPMGFGQGQGY